MLAPAYTGRWWLGLLGLSLCGAGALPAPADPPDELFGVAGNQQIIWLFQNMTHAESKQTALFFTYRPLEKAKKTRFAPRPFGPIGGEIAAMAVSGRKLHIIYSDGTHQSLVPPTGPWSMIAGCKQVRERNLPDSTVPMALAGDLRSEQLYALITSRRAAALMPAVESVADHTSGKADPEGVGEDASPRVEAEENERARSALSADLTVVRFEQGRWALDRAAPADFRLHGRPLAFWAAAGRIHLIYRPDRQSKEWIYRVSAASDHPWSESVVWPAAADPEFASGSVALDHPVLLVGRQSGRDPFLQYWRLNAAGWEPVPLAGSELADVALLGSRFSAYVAGTYIGLARREKGEPLHFGRWDVVDGSTVDPLAPVPALIPPEPPTVTTAAKHLLEYTVLGLALAAVFIWRRSSIAHHPTLAPNQRLARLSRRAMAFGIDMLILTPAVIAVFYRLLVLEETAFPIWNSDGVSSDLTGRYWFRALVGVCVGVYGAIFEAAMSATPGKRALRLTVVSGDGRPIGLGGAFVRNFARAVEFHFVPLVLLVAVTFGKQRLGDLLARSYVVEPTETTLLSLDMDSDDDSDFD